MLSRLRTLIFESMTANVNGLARFLSQLPYMEPVADWLKRRFRDVAGVLAMGVRRRVGAGHLVVTLIGWWALSHVLTRLSGVSEIQKLDSRPPTSVRSPRCPVRLQDVTFRYPSADHDALGPRHPDRRAG